MKSALRRIYIQFIYKNSSKFINMIAIRETIICMDKKYQRVVIQSQSYRMDHSSISSES